MSVRQSNDNMHSLHYYKKRRKLVLKDMISLNHSSSLHSKLIGVAASSEKVERNALFLIPAFKSNLFLPYLAEAFRMPFLRFLYQKLPAKKAIPLKTVTSTINTSTTLKQ